MKRLVLKFVLFAAPFLLALVLFFAFEPYDYLGLRGNATYISMPLSSLRALKREQPANIILGDSRMANLNTDYIEELTGESYRMLGFGGAQLGECVELFWYAAEHTELRKVVFGVSFYTASGEQGPGRIPAIIERAESPFKFMTNANYWLEAVSAAKYKAVNLAAGLLGRTDLIYSPEDPTLFTEPELPTEMGVGYRLDLEEYCAVLASNMAGFELRSETLKELEAVIRYCDENGIELTFVFPPMQECVFDLVTGPLGIDDDIARFKSFLIERADVLDLEFKNEFTCEPDNFYDGFHLVGSRKKLLAEAIFTDVDSPMIHRYREGGE